MQPKLRGAVLSCRRRSASAIWGLAAFGSFACTGRVDGAGDETATGGPAPSHLPGKDGTASGPGGAAAPGGPPGGGVNSAGAPGGEPAPGLPAPPAPTVGIPPGRARPAGVPLAGTDQCRPPRERVWQLSPLQIANAAVALVPTADVHALKASFERYAAAGQPYTSDPAILNASALFASELVGELEKVVALLLKTPAAVHPCVAAGVNEACASQVIDAFAARAFRRPVAADQKAALIAFFRTQLAAHGPQPALALLLRRILGAPEVLFRSEVGILDAKTGLAGLAAHELADLVAFTLTDAPPDPELRAAADAGTLRDPATLEKQVRRLLAAAPPLETIVEGDASTKRRVSGLLRFLREWLDVDLTRLATRPKLGGSEERVLRWLDNEVMTFLRHVLWQDGGRLETLLGANYTFYSNTLASHYGLANSMPASGVPLPTQQGRRGLLMQSSFLTGHHSATARGLFVRGRLLCQTIKAPPSVDMNLDGLKVELEAQNKRKLSPREVRARHMEDPQCSTCHKLLDPLGFPFDGFDNVGLSRATWDGGFAIDTAGEILGTRRSDVKVANAADLVGKLVTSPDVRDCFVEQLYAYVHGRAPTAEDTCYLQRLTARFADTKGDVRELLVHMLVGEEMRQRVPLWEVK